MSRLARVLIFGGLGIALLCCGGGVAVITWISSGAGRIDTSGQGAFDHRLAIPPLAPSTVDDDGVRVFDLTARPGRHDFGEGPVETWGFDGAYLGPTLRATRGERVRVDVHNQLGETTTVHWHGMHLPAAMDGGPHQPISAGASWSPEWTVNQPASTLWYHPHLHGETARHVYRGLAGMFILDDPATDSPALPREYGVDDIPVIVQDKRFSGDQLSERGNFLNDVGILGDRLVVNGTIEPYLPVRTEHVRLRLLNGSNARIYDFGFADNRPFALVGTDGGLLAAAHRTDRIRLSPGERAEIVVTMRPGERAVLRSTPPPLGFDSLAARLVGGEDTFDVLELRADDDLRPSADLPATLTDLPRLDREQTVREQTFRLSGHQINGRRMSMDRIDTTVVKDTVELWRVRSDNGDNIHSFHIHDTQFQVLTVDGQPPPPELAGWKDTIYLPPHVEYELAVPFTDYSDPNAPYMYHCHVLNQEDQGMMGQFLVLEPGQRPGSPKNLPGHEHHD